jgi:hypothetical protein
MNRSWWFSAAAWALPKRRRREINLFDDLVRNVHFLYCDYSSNRN